MILFVLLVVVIFALLLGNYCLTLKAELRSTGTRLHLVTFGVTTFMLLASIALPFLAMSQGCST